MTQSRINELAHRHQEFKSAYAAFQALGLSLDMTRGKPSAQQLDLSDALLSLPGGDYVDASGTDTRNYGGLDGLPDMKALFAGILEIDPANVIVGGSSSLTMMYDALARACLFGVVGGDKPWIEIPDRKFICLTPGYDRHFLVTERLGFELIAVDMLDHGPDMDQVDSLVRNDDSIKGIWCVPKFSNPTGVCYSAETVERLAKMETAAPDFRIMWDNAYAEHHFEGDYVDLANIAKLSELAGNADRIYQFASTSKITHPGSGVAAMGGSAANIAEVRNQIEVQTIGPDKVNQLRHLRLFGDLAGLRRHMTLHAGVLKPKFKLVLDILQEELGDLGIASWTRPTGGYFISLDVPDGMANEVVSLAAGAGVKLTAAGAPFPYGKDPQDQNIRIAPSFPPPADIEQATRVLTACVKLAASRPG
jgi:DNA-binding transcriptional MocR family regulator